ncbi:hypothetical protein SFRURICE_009855 [Spodoptera frugiperda]|nr:hypothetical protein SFRURICE_009855 [Spodoptera frugiperda]
MIQKRIFQLYFTIFSKLYPPHILSNVTNNGWIWLKTLSMHLKASAYCMWKIYVPIQGVTKYPYTSRSTK